MTLLYLKIEIIVVDFVIGAATGLIANLISDDLNLKQRIAAFGIFALFGLLAGIVTAIKIELPKSH